MKYSILITYFLILPTLALANHGPGTTGGGSITQSAQTLKQGSFSFSISETYTNYESISAEEAEGIALFTEGFDAIDDAFLTQLNFAYGISDNFQLELGIGWYSGRNFIDAELEEHDGELETESSIADPEGLTDLSLRGKYRLYQGRLGQVSSILGIIFPVGDDDERLSNDEILEPSSQPGSGTISIQAGLAYSNFITPKVTLNASSLYTYRRETGDFQIGQRVDNAITLAYKISEAPEVSLFLETAHLYLDQDQEDGENNINSGGHSLFLTPGVQFQITKDIGISLSPSFPVLQDLSGEQPETDFRIQAQIFFQN